MKVKATKFLTDPLKLSEEKSKPSNRLGDYVIFLFGLPKIGKTTFASCFPDTYFLMCEKGAKALRIMKSDPRDWDEFLGYLRLLEKSKYQTVVVDTVDSAYDMCEAHVLKVLGIEHESDEGWGKGWAMVRKEWNKAIRRILEMKKGVVFLGHSREKEIKRRGGEQYNQSFPTLNERALAPIAASADLWGYYRYSAAASGGREILIHGNENTFAGKRLKERFVGIKHIDAGRDEKETYEALVKAFNTTSLGGRDVGNSRRKIRIRRS